MEKRKRVTTSIKIDPELWKKAKIYSIEKGVDLSELVEQLLQQELKKRK